jgi:hypothetical protein
MWFWPIVVGGAALMFLLKGSRGTPADVEWLARMIVMEAGDIDPGEEWAGIMNVALNRAARQGIPVREVVATTRWPGGGPDGRLFVHTIQQPGGTGYEDRKGRPAPPDHRRWREALAVAQAVVRGEVPNPIGPRTHFFHPGGMPRCSGEGERIDGKYCIDGRVWPRWSVPEHSEYTPIRVGRAVFS